MNIFTRLKENKNFTHLERSISDFILDDPMTFIKLDKNEIVQTCFVSLSTLYRFLDKIQVKNLNLIKSFNYKSISRIWKRKGTNRL